MNAFLKINGRRLMLAGALLAMAMVLAACGGNKGLRDGAMADDDQAAMQGRGEQGRGVRGRDIDVRGLEGIPAEDREMFTDPGNPLSTRIVYFDLDSSAIPSRFSQAVQAHAQYLASNPDVNLRLEGHTDERGTREYNVALGERRAQSVEQGLTLSGASGRQITTLSFGEERPAELGSTEEAYSQNRRVEFIYVE